MENLLENSMIIIQRYEQIQDMRKWQHELPALHFEKEWDVKIIPPFQGAIIRFAITYNNKHVSVYFDAYSRLGWMYDENDDPIPYFEYFDGEDIHRYWINESDEMMSDIKAFLES